MARARRRLGRTLLDAGKHTEALAELEAVVRMYPEEWLTYVDVAHLFERRGRPDVAILAYEEILRLKPNADWARERLSALRAELREAEAESSVDARTQE